MGWSVGSTGQRVAEGIIAENLARWKPILDEVLAPDSDKIRDGQVHCVVAALASLLQKGAKMPYSASEKDPSLRQIAADAQSTHRSNVNLVLKKYISAAKALVERCLQGEALEAAGCLTTELADSACDCPCEMDNPWASKRMSFAERIAAF